MVQRFATAALLAAAMMVANGCCTYPYACGPMGACGDCGPAACGPVGSCVQDTLTCGSGCGEVYWGELINHPPKCDPCDNYGNWAGDCCGNWSTGVPCPPVLCSPFAGLRHLWGYRFAGCDACCDDGCEVGCESCGTMSTSTILPLDSQSEELQAPPSPEPEAAAALRHTMRSRPMARQATYTQQIAR